MCESSRTRRDFTIYTRSAAGPDAGLGMVLELLWPVDDQQRLCTEHCMSSCYRQPQLSWAVDMVVTQLH